jgi:methyltransferase
MLVRAGALAVLVFGPLLAEAGVSHARARRLRARGAIEPPGDAYRAMSLAYPGVFAAMIAEGAWRALPLDRWFVAGLCVFTLAKVLKYAAIAALAERWSFRVLVLPGAPLVTRGPYRAMRHPNYVAVIGEIAAVALMAPAPALGPLALITFGQLLRKRVAHEERALGLAGRRATRPRSPAS